MQYQLVLETRHSADRATIEYFARYNNYVKWIYDVEDEGISGISGAGPCDQADHKKLQPPNYPDTEHHLVNVLV